MTISHQGRSQQHNKLLLAASVLSLTVQLLPSASTPVFASAASRQAANMQVPIIDKMDDNGSTTSNKPATPLDLSPMTLDATTKAAANGCASSGCASSGCASSGCASGTTAKADGDNNETLLKSTVSATDFVPKGLLDKDSTTVAPVSIKADRDDVTTKVLKDAHKENLQPLALMESDSETDKKLQTESQAEKVQLSELWDATLTRSPDIHFVTQKLMPTNNHAKAAGVMMRLMSAAMFGAMGAVNMMSPTPGTYMATQGGGSMLAQVLGATESKNAKAAKLSETEMIMLYNMVRQTAEKVVDNFREYKTNLKYFTTATADLADLQQIAHNSPSENPAIALEKEATLRKAQRELQKQSDEVAKFRQALVDQAGPEAVAKLDKQLVAELKLLDPTQVAGEPTAAPADQTAAKPDAQVQPANPEAQIAAANAVKKATNAAKDAGDQHSDKKTAAAGSSI